MGQAIGILVLLVGAAALARTAPAMAAAVAGRQMEVVVRARDLGRLLRMLADKGGQSELGRVLRELPTRDLVVLGDAMAGAAGDARGALALAAIGSVVEERLAAVDRWSSTRAKWIAQEAEVDHP